MKRLVIVFILWAIVMVNSLCCVLCHGATLPMPKFTVVLHLPVPQFKEWEDRTAKPAIDPMDQEFLEKEHWWLSPGTCGMLGCTDHGGGWVKKKTNKASPAKSKSGCVNGMCPAPQRRRLFGRLRGG